MKTRTEHLVFMEGEGVRLNVLTLSETNSPLAGDFFRGFKARFQGHVSRPE